MQLKPDALVRQLSQSLLPAYLIGGDEPFQQLECADLIRARAREQGYLERQVFSMDSGIDWSALYTEAQALSLFGGARILDIRLQDKRPDRHASEILVQLLERPAPDTLILITCSRLDRRRDLGSRWVKALDQVGAIIEVWPISAAQLPRWIEQRLRHVGLSADAEALSLLAERSEGNLLACAQEIDKLRLLCHGPLSARDVELAVGHSSRYTPFDLGDAAGQGDAARALRMLDALQAEGVEAPVVLWALTRELRSVADPASAGRMPLQRQKALEALRRRLSARDLAQALALAARVDQSLKGMVPGDPWQHLASLLLRLCGQPLPPPLEAP